MKTVRLVKEFTDLVEAITASKNKSSMEYYAKSETTRLVRLHKEWCIEKYYLTENDELVYMAKIARQIGVIVHKFDYVGCLDNNAAAVVYFDFEKMTMTIGDYKYRRDYLRRISGYWTTDSF
jgi:hypothetical protein